MQAELKRLSSTDVEMRSFVPDDEGCFGFWCLASIGSINEEGADLFQFCVCTPSWLAMKMRSNEVPDPGFGRGLILISHYDFDKVAELIARYLARCSGDDWDQVASKVGRVGLWEFEDYQPYSGPG